MEIHSQFQVSNNMNSAHTLYIRNLNEKVGLKNLRKEIAKIFLEHGYQTLAIYVCKNLKLKGQAFVSMRDSVDLDQVIEKLQTKLLYGKPMILQHAKTDADLVFKQKLSEEEFDKLVQERRRARQQRRKQKTEEISKKRPRDEGPGENEHVSAKHKKLVTNKEEPVVPNKMMILTKLPEDITKEEIVSIFDKFGGFFKVNHVKVRKLALVEFQNEQAALECYKRLGPKLEIKEKPDCLLTFAKN